MNPIHKQIAAIVSQALQIPEVVYNRLNIIPHTSAIHPQFLKYQPLLNSFREWRYMGQASPEYLAESGFFCINEADTVKCFCCGLTLQGWKRDFNPDEQHKHYRKRCLYLCLKENTHPELDHLKTFIIVEMLFSLGKRTFIRKFITASNTLTALENENRIFLVLYYFIKNIFLTFR